MVVIPVVLMNQFIEATYIRLKLIIQVNCLRGCKRKLVAIKGACTNFILQYV